MRKGEQETLGEYLASRVFGDEEGSVMQPDPADVAGFDAYLAVYKEALAAERAAVRAMPL